MAFTCEVPSIEVEDREFLLTKEWKAKEIIRTGQGDPNPVDLESFRLKLNQDFTFTKTEFSDLNTTTSEFSGTWNLIANQSQLELTQPTDSIPIIDRYAIISLKLREIQMDWTYTSNKDPESIGVKVPCSIGCIRYILEPVKE